MRAALGFEQSGGDLRVEFGTGVAGRIAESTEPMVFDDLGPSDFVNASLREAGVRSMLGAPLRIGHRVLGVVQVGSVEPRAFRRDEIELIRLAAGRIALAVDHGHLYEAETLARGRLTLLAESSEVLGESLDYHSALASMAKLLVPWLADWCLIEVTGERGAGLAAHADPAMISLVEALAGGAGGDRGWVAARVAQTGAPELARDASPETLVSSADPDRRGALEELGLRSAMIVPLRSRGRTHGVITLATSTSDRRYDASDLGVRSRAGPARRDRRRHGPPLSGTRSGRPDSAANAPSADAARHPVCRDRGGVSPGRRGLGDRRRLLRRVRDGRRRVGDRDRRRLRQGRRPRQRSPGWHATRSGPRRSASARRVRCSSA